VLLAPILDLASITLPLASITRILTDVSNLLSSFNVKNVVDGLGITVTFSSSSDVAIFASPFSLVAFEAIPEHGPQQMLPAIIPSQ
jgi:hypothetical protein